MAWTEKAVIVRSFSTFYVAKLTIVLVGTSSPAVDWELRYDLDRSAVGTLLASGTATSVTTGDNSVIAVNVPANRLIWVEMDESAGSVSRVEFYLLGRETNNPVIEYHVLMLTKPVAAAVPTTSYQGLPLLLNRRAA